MGRSRLAAFDRLPPRFALRLFIDTRSPAYCRWRDLHPEWRSIKARLAAEEEDLRIAREEEEALSGGGEPEVEIEIDREETEDEVMNRITSGWKG